jgi:hypothetical protein
MNKQQTAVEWIEYQVQQQGITHYFSLREIIEQAKQMEKGQIKDAFINGFCNANDTEDKSLNADEIFYRTRYGGDNKAREYDSPLIKELIDETTPEEMNKIDKEMSNKNQTAVQWLIGYYYDNEGVIGIKQLEQAEQMERQQIIDAVDGFPLPNRGLLGDDYYEETYGGKK